MPYEWKEPEAFLEHRSVKVYHTYKGPPGQHIVAEHWYSWDPSDTDYDSPFGSQFDERDLPFAPGGTEGKIRRFIDSKLDSPKEEPWNYPWNP